MNLQPSLLRASAALAPECFLRSFASGAPLGLMTLSAPVFACAQRPDLMHRAILYETAWRRQGTEASKTLGQVRGTTRKPFPQKGRGKARVGTLRAAQFVGGYAVHGPKPGPRLPDIQRKVYDAAVRSALSTKFMQNQLVVVDSLCDTLPAAAYKSALMDRIAALGLLGKKIYFMYGNPSVDAALGLTRCADMFTVKKPAETAHGFGERRLLVSSADLVSVTPVLENEFLVVDKAAVELLEEMYHVD